MCVFPKYSSVFDCFSVNSGHQLLLHVGDIRTHFVHGRSETELLFPLSGGGEAVFCLSLLTGNEKGKEDLSVHNPTSFSSLLIYSSCKTNSVKFLVQSSSHK